MRLIDMIKNLEMEIVRIEDDNKELYNSLWDKLNEFEKRISKLEEMIGNDNSGQ